jgi:BASS family bile acid:Na+ symporter
LKGKNKEVPGYVPKTFTVLALLFLAAAAALAQLGVSYTVAATCCVVGLCALATASGTSRRFRGFSFSLWVGAFVAAAMFFPELFRAWGSFETKRLIVPLIQIIMFGMGTILSLGDFARVLAIPKAVAIGMFLQFSVMPLLGAGLAVVFGFPAEVAAGVVLIGSCPGGVASNVMTFLARGNVALSVTMTACSTIASPFVTPLVMKVLAGQYIEIDIVNMMLSILWMVVVPVVGGLIANRVLRYFNVRGAWLDRALSWLAMSAICLIIAIITSLSREQLLSVGLALVAAAVLHNTMGYVLGYSGAWLLGLEETDRRTVAIEVGLQNGGMASGLAVNVLKSTDAALAPAIFGPWMNMSGSMLASWWRTRS